VRIRQQVITPLPTTHFPLPEIIIEADWTRDRGKLDHLQKNPVT
jgi:hypothetical protein